MSHEHRRSGCRVAAAIALIVATVALWDTVDVDDERDEASIAASDTLSSGPPADAVALACPAAPAVVAALATALRCPRSPSLALAPPQARPLALAPKTSPPRPA